MSACGVCQGKGTSIHLCTLKPLTCSNCQGSGVETRRPEWIQAGQKAREDRVARGLSLGDEARRLGVKLIEVADMERGRRAPFAEDQK